jgi:prepilin signal peptidase PulO-like enzyme (type II secretory pathway)
MTAAAIQDYIEKQIYTVTLYGGIICSATTKIMYLYVNGMYYQTIQFIAIVFILKMLFLLLSELAKNKIGDGDFDLFIIMYCICGAYGAVLALTIASGIGCMIYLPLIAIKKETKHKQLPFAPLLLAGTIAKLLLSCFGIF